MFFRKKYEPILIDIDLRDENERFNDERYLEQVKIFSSNRAYLTEVSHLLRKIRGEADNCMKTEELLAYNKCIAAVKQILIIGKTAENMENRIKTERNAKDEYYRAFDAGL